MLAVQARKAAAVKRLSCRVRHALAIVPETGRGRRRRVITGTMARWLTRRWAGHFSYRIRRLRALRGSLPLVFRKGLSIDSATGEIAGTPAEAGTLGTIALNASSAKGAGTGTLILAVTGPTPSRPGDECRGRPPRRWAAVYVPDHGNQLADRLLRDLAGRQGEVPPASSLPAGLTYDTATGTLSGSAEGCRRLPDPGRRYERGRVATKLVTLTVREK